MGGGKEGGREGKEELKRVALYQLCRYNYTSLPCTK